MSPMSDGDGRNGPRRRPPERIRRRDRLRDSQQSPEQVRRHPHVEEQGILVGQRQDHPEGMRLTQHAVVLRRRHLRRQGHKTDAK